MSYAATRTFRRTEKPKWVSRALFGLTALAVTSLVPSAHAQTLYWDPGLAHGTGTFGSGTWDTTTALWSNGTTDTTYVSASNAVFGGTSTGAATVTLSGAQNAATLALNTTGYAFAGSALTISSTFASAPGITTAVSTSTTFSNAVNFSNGTGTYSNMGLGNGSSVTLTGGGAWVNTFKVSSAANNGGVTTGTLNLNGGTYTMGALWTQATVNQGAATLTNVGSSLIGYAGNSTYTLNNASSVFNQNSASSLYLGRGGTTGTFNLQNGTLSLAGGSAGGISAGFRDNGSVGVFNVSGGTVSAAANTLALVDAYNNTTGNSYSGTATISGGTTSVAGVLFYGSVAFPTQATVFSGTNSAILNVSGGTLYLGTGGLALSTATSGTRTTAINLSGGTIGATAAWNASLPMTLSNTNGGITFQAANAAANANNITLSGVLSGAGTLTKTGAGTLTLSVSNTYSGGNVVTAGTLTQGAAGALGSASGALTLGGGTLNTNAITTTLGVVTVSAGSSLDFGATGTATTLNFADSSAQTWSGLLTVLDYDSSGALNVSGIDKLFFGTSGSAISDAELASIRFFNPTGLTAGTYTAARGASGEIVVAAIASSSAPEPASLACLVFGGVGVVGARRKMRKVSRSR